VFEAIGEVSATFTTVLMTDNMDSLERFTAPALKLNEVFDMIWNSYDHGMLKNDDDGRAYLGVCNQLGADIHECILIDDREHSVDTFARLGGHTCLTEGPRATLEYLRELSNVPEAL
jgi:FMN phosphatase YigB (HAD superfamily)